MVQKVSGTRREACQELAALFAKNRHTGNPPVGAWGDAQEREDGVLLEGQAHLHLHDLPPQEKEDQREREMKRERERDE